MGEVTLHFSFFILRIFKSFLTPLKGVHAKLLNYLKAVVSSEFSESIKSVQLNRIIQNNGYFHVPDLKMIT